MRSVKEISRSIYYFLIDPKRNKLYVNPMFTRKVYYFFADSYDALSGRRDSLTPPKSLIFIGGGDFKKIGDEFLKHFIEIGELKPTDKVLDVGCGVGRMAVALAKYLSPEGSYEGFDIVPEGIKWCTKKITSKYPNFHFQVADIFNKRYNPKGKSKASEYIFPYASDSFDFIFLTSVFTHLLPDDTNNYLSEIARVLKSNGRCLITFLLLNDESLKLMSEKKSVFDLQYNFGEYRTEDKTMPEKTIGYNESFIRELFKRYGLKISEPVHYGSWCGRKNFLSFQDIIIAKKETI